MTNFCLTSLKLSKIALVHSTDAFDTGGEKALLGNEAGLYGAAYLPFLDAGEPAGV